MIDGAFSAPKRQNVSASRSGSVKRGSGVGPFRLGRGGEPGGATSDGHSQLPPSRTGALELLNLENWVLYGRC
jgi:hypothetical protein